MGCQLAGVVAVPASSPFPSQRGRRVETLRAIAANSGAGLVLTSWHSSLSQRVVEAAPEMRGLEWIGVDEIDGREAAQYRSSPVTPDSVAFLQYTSGSTSLPKGVVVTHAMLLHNTAYIEHALGACSDDVMVSWLPLFHDMGLIGAVLAALYSGAQTVLMPPSVFVRRPLAWLAAIDRYRGTVAAAPDSAYRLCVERTTVEDREALDLRSWRVALNGSEPIAPATLDAFTEAFGPCGFHRSSWMPTYGLAECTLMATAPPLDAEPTTAEHPSDARRRLVGCGSARLHRRVEIIDPGTGIAVEPGAIGEIWLGGPDVAQRYWGNADVSASTFVATPNGSLVRTGDLGFMRDGELYLSGRAKDVIIVSGRNHYPQDIEATVLAAHDVLVDGGCAAFSIERGGRELVVLVAELRSARRRNGVDLDAVTRQLRAAVAAEHGVALADVVLVERKSVPRTSSGKLQRSACRELYERGRLSRAVAYAADGRALAPPSDEERRAALRREVIEQISSVLNTAPGTVDTTRPFQELGLDSLTTMALRERLEPALGERLTPATFFAHPTTDALIDALLDGARPVEQAAPASAGSDDDDLVQLDDAALMAIMREETDALRAVAER